MNFFQKIIQNIKTSEVPWYYQRWLWATLIFLTIFSRFSIYSQVVINKAFAEKILNYFQILAISFFDLFVYSPQYNSYYVIFYYVLLATLFYFAFKKEKVNVKLTTLIIILIVLGDLMVRGIMMTGN